MHGASSITTSVVLFSFFSIVNSSTTGAREGEAGQELITGNMLLNFDALYVIHGCAVTLHEQSHSMTDLEFIGTTLTLAFIRFCLLRKEMDSKSFIFLNF